jgi:hypothetical protein
MTSITGAEAERRIAHDDGDRTDTVWIRGTYFGSRTIYHDTRDCRGFNRETERRTIDRGQAQQRLFAPCAWCVIAGRPEAANE